MTKMMKLVASLVLVGGVSVYADQHGAHAADVSTFALDKAHSQVGFSVRHLGLANVSGTFGEYDADFSMTGEDFSTLSLSVTVSVPSIDTRNTSRDNHLLTPDYFDAETHPAITFVSTGVVPHGNGHALQGHLTIKGVTREVTLPAEFAGPVSDPWGNTKIGIQIGGTIDRHDYGVAHDALSDAAIGDTITFDVQLQAAKQ